MDYWRDKMAKKVVVKKKKKSSASTEENQKNLEGNKKPRPQHFKPGQSGNPAGRAKGSRNKFAAAFIEDFYEDWQEHGSEAIKAVREKDPATYVRVGSTLIPKEFNLNDNSDEAIDRMLDKLDDDELNELIAGLTAIGRQEISSQNSSEKNKGKVRVQSDSVH